MTNVLPKKYMRERNVILLEEIDTSNGEKQMVVTAADDKGLSHLACYCELYARKSWCPHVHFAYQHQSDSEHLTQVPVIQVMEAPWLAIPTVVILDRSTQLHEVRVLWGNVEADSDHVKAEGEETIGFISEDEGRGAIRDLILGWLPAIQVKYPDEMTCRKPTHLPGDCSLESNSEHFNDQRYQWRDAYNLLDERSCCSCSDLNYIPAEI